MTTTTVGSPWLLSTLSVPSHHRYHHRHRYRTSATRIYDDAASHGNTDASEAATAATTSSTWGQVVRVSVKAYHPVHSKPTSSLYTTHKPSCVEPTNGTTDDDRNKETITKAASSTLHTTQPNVTAAPTATAPGIRVTHMGLEGDYNHYRATVLQNTTDRAVSIVTTDCYDLIRQSFPCIEWGDLGENILVDGVTAHSFFVPRAYYRIETRRVVIDNDVDNEARLPLETVESATVAQSFVDIRITEAMIPCANLCSLLRISNEALTRPERVRSCHELLRLLDQAPGWRGWYAAVVREGILVLPTSSSSSSCPTDAATGGFDSNTIIRRLLPENALDTT